MVCVRRFAQLLSFLTVFAAVTAQAVVADPGFRFRAGPVSQAERAFLKPPLTACQAGVDLCITDPARLYHAYFFNPAAGLCEYQITITWGDKTTSQITLKDEVYIDHTYPGPGLYKYRASSPPGTGADCPAGEVRYTFEVPLSAAEAVVVKDSVQLLKKQVKIGKRADHAETVAEQRQVIGREIKLAKKADAKLDDWRSEDLPKKPSDPGTNKPYQLEGTYRSVKEIAGFDWCLGTPRCYRVGINHIEEFTSDISVSPLGAPGH